MLTKFSNWLEKITNKWTILFFLAGEIFFNAVILPNAEGKIKSASGGAGPLDLTFFPSVQEIFSRIEAYGENGRALYRGFELSGDVLYPIIYGFLFSLLISALLKKSLPAGDKKHTFNLLPFAAVIFDYLENISIVTLINTYPDQNIGLANLLGIANALKWVAVGLSVAAMLYGLILKVWKK